MPTYDAALSMLGYSSLRHFRLLRQYPAPPALGCDARFPLRDLGDINEFSIQAYVTYESDCPFLFPHRVHLSEYDDNPLLSIGDRLSISIPSRGNLSDHVLTAVEFKGWIVGIHFEVEKFVEFTVLAVLHGSLQIVFMGVPQDFIDRQHFPQNTISFGGVTYWTYMTPLEVEARARFLRGMSPTSNDWGHSASYVQSFLMTLRTTGVGDFYGVDLDDFPSVRILLILLIFSFDSRLCL